MVLEIKMQVMTIFLNTNLMLINKLKGYTVVKQTKKAHRKGNIEHAFRDNYISEVLAKLANYKRMDR